MLPPAFFLATMLCLNRVYESGFCSTMLKVREDIIGGSRGAPGTCPTPVKRFQSPPPVRRGGGMKSEILFSITPPWGVLGLILIAPLVMVNWIGVYGNRR